MSSNDGSVNLVVENNISTLNKKHITFSTFDSMSYDEKLYIIKKLENDGLNIFDERFVRCENQLNRVRISMFSVYFLAADYLLMHKIKTRKKWEHGNIKKVNFKDSVEIEYESGRKCRYYYNDDSFCVEWV